MIQNMLSIIGILSLSLTFQVVLYEFADKKTDWSDAIKNISNAIIIAALLTYILIK